MCSIRLICIGVVALAALSVPPLHAHVGPHPSVHDTVASILDRLGQTLSEQELKALTPAAVLERLTPSERQALANEHLTFRVRVPVVVTVLRDTSLTGDPFWLAERGFHASGLTVVRDPLQFEAWTREFPAGEIGLGVNSIQGGGEHYLVLVRPAQPGAEVEIDNLYPGQLRVGDFVPGVKPYADRTETLTNLPPALVGQKIIRTLRGRRDDGRLLRVFRWTEHPSSRRADHVVLTWSGPPQTTQTIQWRTSPQTTWGYVAFGKRADLRQPHPKKSTRVKARTELLTDPRLVNDARVHRHTIELTGLEPGTAYVYSVGDGSRSGWSEWAEFTTAPAAARPFSFVYLGDAQNGLDRWGSLVQRCFRERPDAAFYLMAGDLVNRGNERDDWDSLFANAQGVFDRRTLVPVLGNHECQGGHPRMYLQQFALPRNGPPGIEAERAYAFEYSNALFVILDSNLAPTNQVAWLEEQLGSSRATWKFVSYHHPAYSSSPGRDNAAVRAAWVPLFDRHQVDLVLQGHDHAYLRTHPMRGGERVDSPAEGTTYVVSVSGTKMYAQKEHDYTAVGLTKTSTYQVLDIQVSGDRLVYRAYDADGQLRDQFVIEKRLSR